MFPKFAVSKYKVKVVPKESPWFLVTVLDVVKLSVEYVIPSNGLLVFTSKVATSSILTFVFVATNSTVNNSSCGSVIELSSELQEKSIMVNRDNIILKVNFWTTLSHMCHEISRRSMHIRQFLEAKNGLSENGF